MCVRACVCVCVRVRACACVCVRACVRVRACEHACASVGGGGEGVASVSSKHEGLRVLTATNLHELGLQREAFFALVAIDAIYNNEIIF